MGRLDLNFAAQDSGHAELLLTSQKFRPAPRRAVMRRRPFVLTRLVGDQILAYLDLDVRQTAGLAVARDGVVGVVADEIGLVVADLQSGFACAAARASDRRSGDRGCTAPRHASRAATPLKMSVMQCWATRIVGRPASCALIQQRRRCCMIGLEDLSARAASASAGLRLMLPGISVCLAHGRDRGGHLGIAIAVDHQPRIVLRHERRIEHRGEVPRRDAEGADVPGDVPLEFGGGKPRLPKRRGMRGLA